MSSNSGVKKYFLFSTNMAENNRFSKNFFSKCVAASGARIELDVKELRVSLLLRLGLFHANMIEMHGKHKNNMNY